MGASSGSFVAQPVNCPTLAPSALATVVRCARLGIAATIVALQISACTVDHGVWRKPGVGAETRRIDQDGCLRYARHQVEAKPEPTLQAESARRVELYERCLRSKGYQRVP